MISNQHHLLNKHPMFDMRQDKVNQNGVSYGLSEAGYDIRIAEDIHFKRGLFGSRSVVVTQFYDPETPESLIVERHVHKGRFTLASAIEEFYMPDNLVGIVHDKSTWARFGLSVFNTVIEPGWHGFLTLELVYHGDNNLFIPAGSGIAQVVFHETTCAARYDGKYQRQSQGPTGPILTK